MQSNLAYIFELPKAERLRIAMEILASIEAEERDEQFEPSPELMTYLDSIYERVQSGEIKTYEAKDFWTEVNRRIKKAS